MKTTAARTRRCNRLVNTEPSVSAPLFSVEPTSMAFPCKEQHCAQDQGGRLQRSAESRRRCGGGEPGPGADVGRGEPSPGAEVAEVSPVPAQMWEGTPTFPTIVASNP